MMVTAVSRLLVMLLTFGCAHVTTCSSLYGSETDMLSLLEFKNSISQDPHQAFASWNDSTDFCDWGGVRCRMKNPRRVTSLDLPYKGLVGQISPSLGNLTFLKYLVLSDNRFTAEIPPSLGHLRRLRWMYRSRSDLSNNTLQGGIPSFANCSSLEEILLNGNSLAGKIPADWPPNLQYMSLSANNLAGTIPASLANLTMLKDFRILYNKIEGDIPDEFAKLDGLQGLFVTANRLAGRFPQAILNLSTLVGLSLVSNSFRGELPSNLGNSLPNLQELYLGGNLFQGNIPVSLTNASKLYRVDISANNLTGVVPGSIGKLTRLSHLNLELNKLEAHANKDWQFMYSLANCTELRLFSMHGNHLESHVPASLGNLSVHLETLYLGGNKLSGSFPRGIENFPNLIRLGLESNQFTGAVPEWLGSLRNLQVILLDDNMFTGFIPMSLPNLSRLGVLYLHSNKLGGHIPPSLGSLQMLQALRIDKNGFIGKVPKEIFRIPTIFEIDLSFNNLDGELPSNIDNAKQLTYLHVSSNKLSGDIPHTLGNCRSLERVELDMNSFSGNIPTSFSELSVLAVLNLSYNGLSGSIPASFGDLQLLQEIDLSFNHLEGEAPAKGIFNNAAAVRIHGNQGLCGGAPELHLHACPFVPLDSDKKKQSIVVKLVIPVANRLFGPNFPRISYSDLLKATEGFSPSNLIGRGSYSSVYQGRLFPDRSVVAVKVFSLETRGAGKSFIVECDALRNVRHRNLVPILTACSSTDSRGNDFKALVYEFMPRGDLHKLLHSARGDEGTSGLNYISLAQRLSIVIRCSGVPAPQPPRKHCSL
ncbi:hypothetical protein VPH35_077214 [Triticum aestivum]